jgi:hypothetical protein
MKGKAKLSLCGRYRYNLERSFKYGKHGEHKTVAVVMVNPSTADAVRDDHTIKKLTGFARTHAWKRIIVVNLFAYRATDVSDLGRVQDPVGPHNDDYIRQAFEEADQIIVAWGAGKKFPKGFEGRWLEVAAMVPKGKKLYSIGVPCNDGHPKHPARLAYDTPLNVWKPR